MQRISQADPLYFFAGTRNDAGYGSLVQQLIVFAEERDDQRIPAAVSLINAEQADLCDERLVRQQFAVLQGRLDPQPIGCAQLEAQLAMQGAAAFGRKLQQMPARLEWNALRKIAQ
ncbi:hypothetical protein D3C77_535850 [compost metagenome]